MLNKWLYNVTSVRWYRNVFQRMGTRAGWGCVIIVGIPLVGAFGWSAYFNSAHSGGGPAPSTNIVLVNGTAISRALMATASKATQGAQAGDQYAQAQGKAIYSLIEATLLSQEAAKRHVSASGVAVDKAIAAQRAQVLGANSSDSDWDAYTQQAYGMSSSDFRSFMSKMLAGSALQANLAASEPVTATDANNTNAQVNLDLVLVGTISSSMFSRPAPGSPQPLPDALAKQKAYALYARVKAGADIAAIARANSTDSTAKAGGVTGWRSEYDLAGQSPFGALGYGAAFDAAVQHTKTGGITPMMVATGFSNGYVFAKVIARRMNTPKSFDANKTKSQLQTELATKQLSDIITADLAKAHLVWKDPDSETWFNYYKLQQMEQQQAMAHFGGAPGPVPTASEVSAQQALSNAELADMAKRHPNDATAALLEAQNLQTQMNGAAVTPAMRSQLRDQIISLFVSALQSTEDQSIRFQLASLYRDKKQYKDAAAQYHEIDQLMNASPPYDTNSGQTAINAYEQLIAGYKSISMPDQAAAVQKELALVNSQMAAFKRQDAAQAAANAPPNATPIPTPTKSGSHAPSQPSKAGATGSLPGAPRSGGPPSPSKSAGAPSNKQATAPK
ncbi:MAG: SurA N-terminal domain-containing protein [Armatimonadetes bacterium]|nr:SurA N-terminal domain-containing protein [Armatimonadota bacterium]MDE2205572.1 SurA N-terminal domain-containing protein [Armatimonadota bacterium]